MFAPLTAKLFLQSLPLPLLRVEYGALKPPLLSGILNRRLSYSSRKWHLRSRISTPVEMSLHRSEFQNF